MSLPNDRCYHAGKSEYDWDQCTPTRPWIFRTAPSHTDQEAASTGSKEESAYPIDIKKSSSERISFRMKSYNPRYSQETDPAEGKIDIEYPAPSCMFGEQTTDHGPRNRT